MKTFHYKTLLGLVKATSNQQINFNEFKSRRFYHKTHGWCNFRIDRQEELDKAYHLFAEAVYAKPESKVHLFKYYNGEQDSLFNGLLIIISKNTLKSNFGAAQHYDTDVAYIKRLLRK